MLKTQEAITRSAIAVNRIVNSKVSGASRIPVLSVAYMALDSIRNTVIGSSINCRKHNIVLLFCQPLANFEVYCFDKVMRLKKRNVGRFLAETTRKGIKFSHKSPVSVPYFNHWENPTTN